MTDCACLVSTDVAFLFSIVEYFTMERLSLALSLQIFQLFYENECSVRQVFTVLRATYGQHNRRSGTISNTA